METRGRKPLPDAKRRGRVIGARFTPLEELYLRDYCSTNKISIAAMVRNSVMVTIRYPDINMHSIKIFDAVRLIEAKEVHFVSDDKIVGGPSLRTIKAITKDLAKIREDYPSASIVADGEEIKV